MQFAGNTDPDQPVHLQADQDFHCLFTDSMDIVVYVEDQRMSRSDCTDVHIHLDLCC